MYTYAYMYMIGFDWNLIEIFVGFNGIHSGIESRFDRISGLGFDNGGLSRGLVGIKLLNS